MFLNIIVKSNDDSYFYLYKILLSSYVYTDNIKTDYIENLVFSNIDRFGYIKDTTINLEEILKSKKINKIYVEYDSIYLNKLMKKYNVKYSVINQSIYYKKEIEKLKSVILLKYILDENKQSIYNLNFLILGDNNLSNEIIKILTPLSNYDTYNKDVSNLSLNKYDVIISTENLEINPECLFSVKNNLIIYDLSNNTKLDRNILNNNYIKYRYINNVSIYLPIAKAKLLHEVMCENESL